jgi:anti-sigma regulatory factor (Ser/Thr protein kinase)
MLPASGQAQGVARRVVETMPGVAKHPDLLFAGQLLASELAGNAVRHAGPTTDESILLVVECDGETLRLEVVDEGPGFDPLDMLVRHECSKEPYHGIVLVNALSDRWGFRREDEGMRVWFELDLVPGRRPWRGRDAVRLPPAEARRSTRAARAETSD